jgi:mycofactocin system transcriptional regulator
VEAPQASIDVRATTGRPPVTSTDQLCQIAIELFVSQGFEATSIDDITAAAGIGRRTFFRYFETKADAVWGDFDSAIVGLRASLDASPTSEPMMDALRNAVVAFNYLPQDQVQQHRQRMQLILGVPALISRSSLRYAQWRAAIEEFAARRLGLPLDHLIPRSIGHTALGAALAAHEQWLQDESSDLGTLLNSAFLGLSQGFAPQYANHAKGI